MRLLDRLWQNFAARDLVVGPVIRDFLLRPDARQDIGEFLPHAAGVAQIGPVWGQLVGVAGTAEPDIDAAMAQNVEGRHALRDMQRMVNGRQHHADAEPDRAGALADRRQGEVRCAVVRPHRAEMMLGEPHALEALLLGIGNLLQGLVDALRFAGRGPGFGDLDLVEQANSHETISRGRARRSKIAGHCHLAVSRSISRMSSAVNAQPAARTLASTCSGRVAPAMTLATCGRRTSQLTASSSSEWPRSAANPSRRSTIAQLSS